MASIQTGIQLNDHFTQVLSGIINSVNVAVTRMEELNQTMNANVSTSAFSDVKQQLDNATLAADKLGRELANTDITPGTNEQRKFNHELQTGQGLAGALANKIGAVAAAYGGLRAIQGIVNASDELVQITSRLDMMNDGLQSTEELVNMVYASAQDARGGFNEMASVVARFGNNAKDAFSSTEEVVQFANLIQKQMTIAGASTEEAANAMLQLSQGLGSGVLRGDELNSIFEQAPNLIQNIADYLDVPIGAIRNMAAEGKLTADIVKSAIFEASNQINENFENMPMTWGQVWQSMSNTAVMAFQPVLDQINSLANSGDLQNLVTGVTTALAAVAGVVTRIFGIVASVGSFIANHWATISPIVYGAATALGIYTAYLGIMKVAQLASAAAQRILNSAIWACPVTWIVAAIGAVIALAQYIANTGEVAVTAFGVITGAINVVIQFFKNLGLTVANIALGIGNVIAALGNNIMAAFHNAIASVQSWFYDLLSSAVSVIDGICEKLNQLPFVEFDYSGISAAADAYAAKSAAAANSKMEYKSLGDAFKSGMSTYDTFQSGWASDAYASGAAWGDKVFSKVKSTFSSGKGAAIPDMSDYTAQLTNANNAAANNAAANNAAAQTASNTGKTADNTAKAAKALDVTNEDLKYLRDIAERDVINRYTTASINVNQTNHNNISSNMDLDGVTEHLRSTIEQKMAAAAEGVY